jgi:hypothetical protein
MNIMKNLQHSAARFVAPLAVFAIGSGIFGCSDNGVNPEEKGQVFTADKYYKMIIKARSGSALETVVLADQTKPNGFSYGNDINATDSDTPVKIVATTPSQFADIRFKVIYPDNMVEAPVSIQSAAGNMVVAKNSEQPLVVYRPSEGKNELTSFPEISFKGKDQYTENKHITEINIMASTPITLDGITINKDGKVFIGKLATGLNLQEYRTACQEASALYSGVRALQIDKNGSYTTTLVEVPKPPQ